LQNKIDVYRAETNTDKAIYLTLITANGIAKNKYAENVQKILTFNDLYIF
jgi:hypothetical protein